MKFDQSVEYYYNGERLIAIHNSDNEIQYFVRPKSLDILPLYSFENSILSYIYNSKSTTYEDNNDNVYLLKLKSFDYKYRVTIQCQGSTFDNKREDELHSGTKWSFKTVAKDKLIIVPYYEIEYLIPYNK